MHNVSKRRGAEIFDRRQIQRRIRVELYMSAEMFTCYSPNSTWPVTSRHDTTRYPALAF